MFLTLLDRNVSLEIYEVSLQTASPACTELEVKMMNWLGRLLNLPPQFLNCHSGPGGGVLQVIHSTMIVRI